MGRTVKSDGRVSCSHQGRNKPVELSPPPVPAVNQQNTRSPTPFPGLNGFIMDLDLKRLSSHQAGLFFCILTIPDGSEKEPQNAMIGQLRRQITRRLMV